jgi:hypothetical protein
MRTDNDAGGLTCQSKVDATLELCPPLPTV